MDGIHLLGEWYGCPADTPEFTRAEPLRDLCVHAARDAGLTVVGDRFFQFEPQGVTGTVLLAESHIAIHTWPEAGFVTVDVYVCNLTTDNTAKAEQVFRALEAALQPRAHALPGDPPRRQGCLTRPRTTRSCRRATSRRAR